MSTETTWGLVIPVRGGSGKTRLHIPGVDRQALARAIALDTIAAARACARVQTVVVVTADAELAATLAEGVLRVGDPGTGINGAVAAGLAALDPRMPRAVMLGDIPTLAPADLAAALAAAADHPRIAVPDDEATGTTLVAQQGSGAFPTAFGEGSLARHRALGFRVSTGFGTLHRDVDDASHLRFALSHASGGGDAPRTRAALAAGRH